MKQGAKEMTHSIPSTTTSFPYTINGDKEQQFQSFEDALKKLEKMYLNLCTFTQSVDLKLSHQEGYIYSITTSEPLYAITLND